MAEYKKITWDEVGERFYETGVKNGVLYLTDDNGAYTRGVPWNGLTAVSESPEGADATDLYADDDKYITLRAKETFACTVEAYTYPDEFAECNGELELETGVTIGQQTRKTFGLCYRTTVGNDVKNNDYGYKLHLIYGCTASPSEKSYSTINDSPEAITFSWEIKTTPVNVTNAKPTATLVLDSVKLGAAKMAAVENLLYGSTSAEATLPLPDVILSTIRSASSQE